MGPVIQKPLAIITMSWQASLTPRLNQRRRARRQVSLTASRDARLGPSYSETSGDNYHELAGKSHAETESAAPCSSSGQPDKVKRRCSWAQFFSIFWQPLPVLHNYQQLSSSCLHMPVNPYAHPGYTRLMTKGQ